MTPRLAMTLLLTAVVLPEPLAKAQPEPPKAIKVVVAQARRLEAPATITLVGTVQPLRRSRVGSEIAGIVEEMPVRQGDCVSAGDVLCRLNGDTLEHDLAGAKERLNVLRARHEELLAGTRKEELDRLKALLDEAEADEERWKSEMARVEGLYADRDSNEKEYYDTRAEFLIAQHRTAAARAAYDLAVAGPRKEVIAQAAHEVAQQQAVVDRIASDLQKTGIRAPFDGCLADRHVEIGEWVSVGGPVVEMIDLSAVLVRVDAPESALPYLVVGDPAQVRIDALERRFDGLIKHIIRQAELSARTFPVEIEVPNGGKLLAGGMFARATITGGPKGEVVAVPKDAIFEQGGITHVATVVPSQSGGVAGILNAVTVGAEVGDWIAVTSDNVHPGMPVITRGNEKILPFPTPITIVDEKGNPVPVPENVPAGPRPGGA